MITTNDSIKIDAQFNKLSTKDKESLNKDPIDGLTLSKFSFAIDNIEQIKLIDDYLKNLNEGLKERSTGTYNIFNYNDEANIKNKNLIIEGFNIATYDSLTFSYNILADYSQGSMKLTWNKVFSERLLSKLEKMTEEEYQNSKEAIYKEVDAKAKQKYIEPQLIKLIIDIVVVYKKKNEL